MPNLVLHRLHFLSLSWLLALFALLSSAGLAAAQTATPVATSTPMIYPTTDYQYSTPTPVATSTPAPDTGILCPDYPVFEDDENIPDSYKYMCRACVISSDDGGGDYAISTPVPASTATPNATATPVFTATPAAASAGWSSNYLADWAVSGSNAPPGAGVDYPRPLRYLDFEITKSTTTDIYALAVVVEIEVQGAVIIIKRGSFSDDVALYPADGYRVGVIFHANTITDTSDLSAISLPVDRVLLHPVVPDFFSAISSDTWAIEIAAASNQMLGDRADVIHLEQFHLYYSGVQPSAQVRTSRAYMYDLNIPSFDMMGGTQAATSRGVLDLSQYVALGFLIEASHYGYSQIRGSLSTLVLNDHPQATTGVPLLYYVGTYEGWSWLKHNHPGLALQAHKYPYWGHNNGDSSLLAVPSLDVTSFDLTFGGYSFNKSSELSYRVHSIHVIDANRSEFTTERDVPITGVLDWDYCRDGVGFDDVTGLSMSRFSSSLAPVPYCDVLPDAPEYARNGYTLYPDYGEVNRAEYANLIFFSHRLLRGDLELGVQSTNSNDTVYVQALDADGAVTGDLLQVVGAPGQTRYLFPDVSGYGFSIQAASPFTGSPQTIGIHSLLMAYEIAEPPPAEEPPSDDGFLDCSNPYEWHAPPIVDIPPPEITESRCFTIVPRVDLSLISPDLNIREIILCVNFYRINDPSLFGYTLPIQALMSWSIILWFMRRFLQF